MINTVINLGKEDKNGFIPTLTTYVLDEPMDSSAKRQRPAVLICPGGGYGFCSPREGEPLALMFNAAGFHAFVLEYSVAPEHVFPEALCEVSDSLRLIRQNAKEWSVHPDKIAVLGFSAGGHLAASLGVLWNTEEAVKCEDMSNKPNALILAYPVISSGEYAHRGSFDNLLGDKKDDEKMLEYLSLENRVSKDTPPTFLWHTYADTCVPVENSLMFANALRKADVPFEMHIYPWGEHGRSIATREVCSRSSISPHIATWTKLVCEWLDSLFETDYMINEKD